MNVNISKYIKHIAYIKSLDWSSRSQILH